MKHYESQGVYCEICRTDEAEIFAEDMWLCPVCEFELAAEKPTAISEAQIKWGEARIVK